MGLRKVIMMKFTKTLAKVWVGMNFRHLEQRLVGINLCQLLSKMMGIEGTIYRQSSSYPNLSSGGDPIWLNEEFGWRRVRGGVHVNFQRFRWKLTFASGFGINV